VTLLVLMLILLLVDSWGYGVIGKIEALSWCRYVG
jgi:hypothetical protein